jgi:hypothetical protein
MEVQSMKALMEQGKSEILKWAVGTTVTVQGLLLTVGVTVLRVFGST